MHIFCILHTFLLKKTLFCGLLDNLKEKMHPCWFDVYVSVWNFVCLHLFLPTWRKPNRPTLGRRSLCPERGGCWGWQSPTREHEEPDAAEGEKIFYFLHTVVKMRHFDSSCKSKWKCQCLPLTLPSEEVPDVWPVAMVILSGWTARLVKRKHTCNFIWTSKRSHE